LGSVASGAIGGTLGAVYKLVWYEGAAGDPARIKVAGEKTTWPGRKAVYRVGDYAEDILQLDDEPAPDDATPLLQPAAIDGAVAIDLPSPQEIQRRAAANLRALPERYRALHDPAPYPVRRSERLLALRDRATHARQHASATSATPLA
jgi:nicotinate phosphoribosyltransferase